jgi:hypothetical protein
MQNPLADRSPPPSRRHFQFSLRSLFLFSLVFAVICAGIFNPYVLVRFVTLMAVQGFLFYLYLAWAMYGRGYLQTFGIGAALSFLFPWIAVGILWIFLPFTLIGPPPFQNAIGGILGKNFFADGIAFLWPSILVLILVVDSLFTGGTMVLARWLIDRSRQREHAELSQADAPIAGECATM